MRPLRKNSKFHNVGSFPRKELGEALRIGVSVYLETVQRETEKVLWEPVSRPWMTSWRREDRQR